MQRQVLWLGVILSFVFSEIAFADQPVKGLERFAEVLEALSSKPEVGGRYGNTLACLRQIHIHADPIEGQDPLVTVPTGETDTLLIRHPNGIYAFSNTQAHLFRMPEASETLALKEADTSPFLLELPKKGQASRILVQFNAVGRIGSASEFVSRRGTALPAYSKLTEDTPENVLIPSAFLQKTTLEALRFKHIATPQDIAAHANSRLALLNRWGETHTVAEVEHLRNSLELCASIRDPLISELAAKRLKKLFPGDSNCASCDAP